MRSLLALSRESTPAGGHRETLRMDSVRSCEISPLFFATSQIVLDHAAPRGPVVRVPCLPGVDPVGNALGAHDAVEVLILPEALIVPAGAENVRVAPVAIEEPGIAEIGQVMRRQIEVAVLVVVAVEEVGDVEGAGHAEQAGEYIGMAQRNVGGMVAAEAAAERDEMAVAILEANQR